MSPTCEEAVGDGGQVRQPCGAVPRRMAADLDHRSPDANQWGAASSGVVVGVGAREGAGAGSGGGPGSGGARVRSSKGGVGASAAVGRCWPGHGCGRGRGTTPTATGTNRGTVTPRVDSWGASPLSCGGNIGGGTENREPRSESISRGSCAGGAGGGLAEHQQTTPGSRERRRRERPSRVGTPKIQGQGRGEISESRARAVGRGARREEHGESKGGSPPGSVRRQMIGAPSEVSNEGAGSMDTDSLRGPTAGFKNEVQGSAAPVDVVVGAGSHNRKAHVVGRASNMGLEESTEVEMGGESSEMEGGQICPRPTSSRLAYKLSVNLIDTYKLINQR